LDASGVRQDDVGPRHEIDEGQVVQRLDQENILEVAEQPRHRFADVRVQVHGIHEILVRELFRGGGNGLADTLESSTKALTPVACNQDYATVGLQVGETSREVLLQGGIVAHLVRDSQQRVDHGISSHDNVVFRHALAQQIGLGGLGGGEMELCQCAGQLAVGFFGPGRIDIAGTQPGLHVADRDLLVVGGQRGGEGGCGVAMDQHVVGLEPLQYALHASEDAGRHGGHVLARLHDVQVEVRLDLE